LEKISNHTGNDYGKKINYQYNAAIPANGSTCSEKRYRPKRFAWIFFYLLSGLKQLIFTTHKRRVHETNAPNTLRGPDFSGLFSRRPDIITICAKTPIMKKSISFIIVAVVICALAFWYVQLGKKAVLTGKAVIENQQENIGNAKKAVDQVNNKSKELEQEIDQIK
jgi:hypothetical protein